MHYVYVIKSMKDKKIYTGAPKIYGSVLVSITMVMSRLQKDADLLSLYIMRYL